MTNLSHHRIMLDSVNWKAILAAVKAKKTFRGLPVSLVAGYLDGPVSQWPGESWGEFQAAGITGRALVGITVTGNISTHDGAVRRAAAGDSELGDMTPVSAALWAFHERSAGHWPVVYCDRADKPHIINECAKHGLKLSSDYGLWIATLDDTFADLDGSDLREQPGMVAIQFRQAFSPIHVAGQPPDLDVSLVVSSAWRAARPDPAPAPAPVPSWKARALKEAKEMEVLAARLAARANALTTLLDAHQ